ncbi:phospholipase A2 [Geotalea uraniireducens]|nr:phospholipase A2 [Geotalea uraniireducens]
MYTATLTAMTTDGKCSDSATTQVEVKKGPEQCNLDHDFQSRVNVTTGWLSHSQDLFSLKGGSLSTSISLAYNSLAPRTGPIDTDIIHHFQKALHVRDDGSILYREWDQTLVYTFSDTGYQPPSGDTSTLVKNVDGSYVLTDVDGTVNNFNQNGKISATVEPSGKTYGFAYTADSVTVTDPYNKSTIFSILYYNSINPMTGTLGTGWSHNYEIALQDQGNGAILFKDGQLSRLYTRSGDTYVSPPGDYSTLVKNTDGTFVITEKDGLNHNFDQWGRILSRLDKNGTAMTFAYDGGNLSGVTDGAGRTVTFAYDGTNKLLSVTDPKGNAYTFGYDGGNLITVTNPDSGQWSYTYDPAGFLLTKADPGGNVVTYVYDDTHRVISGTDPEGRSRDLDYAASVPGSDTAKTTTFKEKDGGEWQYTYDTSAGTLTSKTDPLGNTTSFTYDSRKKMLTKTEPVIGTTTYSYDANDYMTSLTDPLSNTTSYTYNSRGQVLTVSGPAGTTTNTYDANGNLLTVTDPARATTTYEYDPKGNVTKITDAKGKATTFVYDASGMLTSTTDQTGATTTYTHDANGSMATSTDTTGKVTTFTYDGMNRLATVTDPLGHVTTYDYDKIGNRTSVTDANGNTTTYKYNYRGQVIEAKDAQGSTTTYTYGATGCTSCGGGVDKLTALTDAKGQTTSWQYDLLGHLASETDPLQKVTAYMYDPAGRMNLKTDANGAAVAYGYDPLRRLTGKTYPDGSSLSYTYDTAGHVQTAANSNVTYIYAYDAAGRATSVTDSRGYTLAYEYDLLGNRTKMKFQPGTADERITTYAYDDGNRLTDIIAPAGTFTYGYDALGRRTSLGYPNQVTAAYTYDDAGRLTSLSHTAGGSTIAAFSYALDNVGNRTSKATTEAENYLYDVVYRLLNAASPKPETFTYDAVGNRQTGPGAKDTGYLHNAGNQMTQGRKLAYGYDNNGNQTNRAVPGAFDKSWTQTWDNENRLVKVEKVKGAEKRTVSFSYDPFGRRIVKQMTVVKDGVTKTSSSSYVYDNDNIALEVYTDETGAVTKTFYTHGAGIDEHLALEHGGQFYYYHADGLGSIVSITDANRNVVQSYEYDSFGMVKPSTVFANSYTYTGREWDKETGLYFYRARYYDPMEGRFISKDPVGFKGGINIYAYVSNNVVNDTDPSGLYPGPCGNDSHQWVPDSPWGFCDFSGPCQRHDDCYGCSGKRQGKTKSQCDRDFLNNMLNTCKGLQGKAYTTCVGAAYVYYVAVSRGGDKDFDNARKCCQ